jgi:hypothetical protein
VSGFLVNGFGEIGRKSNRLGLRRQLAAQERKRQDALAALGRAAWQAGIDLAAFGPQREQLQKLDARAGELSATAARLQKERTDLDARKQAETARFDGLLQPARAKQSEADAALKAARTALAEKEQAIKAAGAVAPPAPADVGARPGLASEVTKRVDESARAAGEVNRLEAEKKAALAPIDAGLTRVRQESSGATRESATVGREQIDRFRDLGLALYDKKHAEPALASSIEAVAAIDRDRDTTQAAIDSSLALTAAMPRGTMAKLWLAILLPIVCAAAAYAAYSRFVSREPADSVEASATPTSGATGVRAEELRKDEAVKALVDSKDPSVRSTAIGILEADLMELGSSADRASIPLLGVVLKRGEPELRAAAAHAIGMIGPTRTELPMLVEALNDPAPTVRDAVAQALDQIDDPSGRLLVRRMRRSGSERQRSRAEGVKPTVLPDASSLGMPVYPGATFLAFASDVGAGRVTFSTPDPIEKVLQFYQKAAGRSALSGEEFSRAYLGASPGDPSGEERLGKETEAWARTALQSGRPPAELEAGMITRMAQLRDLPRVRYADAEVYKSPVFIGFAAPASDGTPVRGRYAVVFEDRSLGRTGFALHLPQK